MLPRLRHSTMVGGATLAVAALLTGCQTVSIGHQASSSGETTQPSATAAATAGSGQPPVSSGLTYGAGVGNEPAGVLPLPVTKPVLNPAVSDANLASTVCTGTKKYRPPVDYTDEVKRIELSTPTGSFGQITDPRNGHVYPVPGYRGYAGLGPSDATRVELDHFLPLSDGGDGYDPTNLWPEIGGTANAPLAGADGKPADSHVKDGLEDYVYRQLCPHGGASRHMTLHQAQTLYEPDWYASYIRLGRPSGSTTN